MNYFANSPVTQALGLSLFHFLWQGALIAAAAAIALRFTARAQLRYAIACGALLAMPAIFAVTLALSIPQAPATAGHIAIAPTYSLNIPPADPTPHARDFSVYLEYAVPLWLAGVVCVLLYRSLAWIFAARLRRRGTCAVPDAWMERLKSLAARARVWQPVVLLESCLAEVPVVIGYLRPAILIPAGMLTGLPAAQIEAILLHELAHIRRADYLVALVQSAVEGLLFYNPAVWWISRVIRAERENCCDDFAIAIQGDPHAYATALATIEASRWRASEPVLAANQGDLPRRIRRILRTSDARDFSLPLIPAAMLLIAAGIAIADQAPQLATLPLKIPVPKAPMLMAQAHTPAPSEPQMGAAYRKWLNEDVVYIITDSERWYFKTLSTDQEREKYIEQFWLRRDPTPGTPENEFKTEHYRRIAFANSRFTASVPGWKTDRGRVYIEYGPPDEIESHPAGNDSQRYPFEQWRYRLIEGIGSNVIVEFDDKDRTGEYRMTMDPNAPVDDELTETAREAAILQQRLLKLRELYGENHPDVAPTLEKLKAVKERFDALMKARSTVLEVPGAGAAAIPRIAIQASTSGDLHMTLPPEWRGEFQVSGVVANGSGFSVAWFSQTWPIGSNALAKKLSLPPGSYTLTVTTRNLTTGKTSPEQKVQFEVK